MRSLFRFQDRSSFPGTDRITSRAPPLFISTSCAPASGTSGSTKSRCLRSPSATRRGTGRRWFGAIGRKCLVVDTGMNALGWSRERAMAYMKEHTLESDTQIATETLRYSTDMPGQALANKTGSLHLRNLRERARRELGDRFDIRE